MTTTQETGTSPIPSLPPPRLERGAVGWARANLFNSRFNATLTVVVGLAVVFAIWFAIQWVFSEADWTVVSSVGGRFLIGNYNSEQACPGNDCFWRPQASLLMVTFLMGMGWGVAGAKLMRNLALATVGACVILAFLPYSFERMGMDVRLLLAANVGSVAAGWALARYTRFGTVKWGCNLQRGGLHPFDYRATRGIVPWHANGGQQAVVGIAVEPDPGAGGNCAKFAHRNSACIGAPEPLTGSEVVVRDLYRGFSRGTTDYAPVYVSAPGAAGIS